MPKLIGAFDLLKNLEQIPPDRINRWLKHKLELDRISNFIGNRIYYPQTVPVTAEEMGLDLAILREALKFNQVTFFNLTSKIIFIPESLQKRFTPLTQLIQAFLDGLLLEGVTQIIIEEAGKKVLVGSVYSANIKNEIKASLDNKGFILKPNSLTLFPVKQGQQILQIDDKKYPVYGGKVGFFTDLREKKWIF